MEVGEGGDEAEGGGYGDGGDGDGGDGGGQDGGAGEEVVAIGARHDSLGAEVRPHRRNAPEGAPPVAGLWRGRRG